MTPCTPGADSILLLDKLSPIARLIDFLALKRSTAAVLVMAILIGMGERMAERFLPIYLMTLGGGALSIGFLNGIHNLL